MRPRALDNVTCPADGRSHPRRPGGNGSSVPLPRCRGGAPCSSPWQPGPVLDLCRTHDRSHTVGLLHRRADALGERQRFQRQPRRTPGGAGEYKKTRSPMIESLRTTLWSFQPARAGAARSTVRREDVAGPTMFRLGPVVVGPALLAAEGAAMVRGLCAMRFSYCLLRPRDAGVMVSRHSLSINSLT